MNDELAQNISPYYNDYERSKEFLQVLFKPGGRVQARELTQLQSILQNQIAILAEYFLDDGNIISGGGISVIVDNLYKVDNLVNGLNVDLTNLETGSYTTNLNNTIEVFGSNAGNYYIYVDSNSLTEGETFSSNVGDIIISEGANFLQDTVHRILVEEGTVFISDRFVGITETTLYPTEINMPDNGKVGFLYENEYVTSKNDTTLNDPSKGTYGYSGSGADRLKIVNTLVFYESNETIPENFLPLVCYENGIYEIVANTPFMNGPDYTQISLTHENGKWILEKEGNTNPGTYEINLCDVPNASNDEIIEFIENDGNILFLSNDGVTCCTRKTPISNIIPIQINATCSGTEPNINIGDYWLDDSGDPPILRRKESSTTWLNIDTNNYSENFTIKCLNSGKEYSIENNEIVCTFNGTFNICDLPSLPENTILDGNEQFAVCVNEETYKTSISPLSNLTNTYIPTTEEEVTTDIGPNNTSRSFTITKNGIIDVRISNETGGGQAGNTIATAFAYVTVNSGDVVVFRHGSGNRLEVSVNNNLVAFVDPTPTAATSQSQIVSAPNGVILLEGRLLPSLWTDNMLGTVYFSYRLYCEL